MKVLIGLVIIASFYNLIGCTPLTGIGNEEVSDGKYLCEALKLSGMGKNLQRNGGFLNSDNSESSVLLKELYITFLKSLTMFDQSLARRKGNNGLVPSEEFAEHFAKRNLDSIGGGHLIKRSDANRIDSY